MAISSEGTGIRTEPLFFKSSDVPQENERWLTHYEICKACSIVANPENNANKKEYIEGAQRIGNLWRVYLNDETARVSLLSQGITLRGQQVKLNLNLNLNSLLVKRQIDNPSPGAVNGGN